MTPDDRITDAATMARDAVEQAITETRFACGLAMRLHTASEATGLEEVLAEAYGSLIDVRDALGFALADTTTGDERVTSPTNLTEIALLAAQEGNLRIAADVLEEMSSTELRGIEMGCRELADLATEERLRRVRRGETA